MDDSSFARAKLRRLFESGGHEVVGSAEGGTQALAMFKSLAPDLVTMDYLMPDKSGEEVVKEIMQYDPDARVIMISGASNEEVEERSMQAGAKFFFRKFDMKSDLLDVINQVLAL